MTDVVELRPQILEKLASDFVDKYEKESPMKAANWIAPKIEPHEYGRMQKLIRKEFEERGYVFTVEEE